jgi:hypothetical protein
MIELLIVACLGSGQCRDFSLLYDSHEVSLTTCQAAAQVELARWQSSHLDWRITRWGCDHAVAGERST